MKQKYKNLSKEKVQDTVNKLHLPTGLKNVIFECINLGKYKNKKGRRYSSDWLLSCLLLNMRSKSTYIFLRRNNILPLPAVSTVRKYLKSVRVKCGLDNRFFELLKNQMSFSFWYKNPNENKDPVIIFILQISGEAVQKFSHDFT